MKTIVTSEEHCKVLLQEAEYWMARNPYHPGPDDTFYVPSYYSDKARHSRAKKPLAESARAAIVLSTAYKETCDSRYQIQSKAYIQPWTRTRISAYDDSALVALYKGQMMIEACWMNTERPNWGLWLTDACIPLLHERNNLGAWALLGKILYTDYSSRVYEEFDAFIRQTVKFGLLVHKWDLPREVRRHNSGLWYTYFCLEPLAKCAVKLNYWPIALERAVGKFSEYAMETTAWPRHWPYKRLFGPFGWLQNKVWPGADKFILERGLPLLEIFNTYFPDKTLDQWLEPWRPIVHGNAFPHATWRAERLKKEGIHD